VTDYIVHTRIYSLTRSLTDTPSPHECSKLIAAVPLAHTTSWIDLSYLTRALYNETTSTRIHTHHTALPSVGARAAQKHARRFGRVGLRVHERRETNNATQRRPRDHAHHNERHTHTHTHTHTHVITTHVITTPHTSLVVGGLASSIATTNSALSIASSCAAFSLLSNARLAAQLVRCSDEVNARATDINVHTQTHTNAALTHD
jgi:hypothetical protein